MARPSCACAGILTVAVVAKARHLGRMVPFAAVKQSLAVVLSESCKKLPSELQAARARGPPISECQRVHIDANRVAGKSRSSG